MHILYVVHVLAPSTYTVDGGLSIQRNSLYNGHFWNGVGPHTPLYIQCSITRKPPYSILWTKNFFTHLERWKTLLPNVDKCQCLGQARPTAVTGMCMLTERATRNFVIGFPARSTYLIGRAVESVKYREHPSIDPFSGHLSRPFIAISR